jgi:hypothetical protein
MEESQNVPTAWEDVSLRIIFLDGNKVRHKDIRFIREEINRELQEEYEAHKASAEESGVDIPEDLGDQYHMSSEEFKRHIFEAAEKVTHQALAVPGSSSNVLRLIPSHSIREVQLTVNNLSSIILA